VKARLTQRTVDTLPAPTATGADVRVYDEELSGFFLRIYYTGRRQYCIQYAVGPKRRRMVLGEADRMTLAEARTKAKATLGDVAKGQDPAAPSPMATATAVAAAAPVLTLSGAMDRYLTRKATKRAVRTVDEQRRMYDRDIAPLFGDRALECVTRAELRVFHESLSDRPIMANRLLFLLRAFFAWAQGIDLLPEGANPAARIELYDEEPRKRRASPTELKRLRRAWQIEERRRGAQDVGLAVLHFLALTGWRKREAYGLRWDVLNRYTGEAEIVTKTGRSTRVLSAAALAVALSRPRIIGSPYVFANPKSPAKPLNDPRAAWDAIRIRARAADLHIHDLRHTVASTALDLGIPYEVRQLLVGHLIEGQTARYSHPSPDVVKAAAERVAAALLNAFRYGAHPAPDADVIPIQAAGRRASTVEPASRAESQRSTSSRR
jgi:integrase